jgi:hypothetical protein
MGLLVSFTSTWSNSVSRVRPFNQKNTSKDINKISTVLNISKSMANYSQDHGMGLLSVGMQPRNHIGF